MNKFSLQINIITLLILSITNASIGMEQHVVALSHNNDKTAPNPRLQASLRIPAFHNLDTGRKNELTHYLLDFHVSNHNTSTISMLTKQFPHDQILKYDANCCMSYETYKFCLQVNNQEQFENHLEKFYFVKNNESNFNANGIKISLSDAQLAFAIAAHQDNSIACNLILTLVNKNAAMNSRINFYQYILPLLKLTNKDTIATETLLNIPRNELVAYTPDLK